MSAIPKTLQKLIEQLTKLPGIGPKTASRLTFSMLNWPAEDLEDFSQAVANLKLNLSYCRECFNMSEGDLCVVCKDPRREKNLIAVVAKPLDAIALEATADYHGVYHVLGGTIAPLEGVGPDDLKIKELLDKVQSGQVEEVILATNADLEGETTAMYLAKQLQNMNVKVTRIARGLPIGGELEYADEVTITSALEGRREYGK